MEKREYGKSKELLSIIGFGGILVTNETQENANNYVARAIDRGVNYFDVAPSYGNAEERLGPALKGKRNKIFLACKTEKRAADEAQKALENSMKVLGTDVFDLYQLHGLTSAEEAKKVLAPGGALETIIKAREKGYVRNIGFSTHSEEAAEILMDEFDFDSVLFPLNWVNIFNSGFGKAIIDKALSKNVTMLALKAMAKTKWEENQERTYQKCWYVPEEDEKTAKTALRYTLSKPICAAITPGYMKFFEWGLDVGDNYSPVTNEEEAYLKDKSTGLKPIF